jgi:hypothetical protein
VFVRTIPRAVPVFQKVSHATVSTDRVLYTPERLSKIAEEASKPDSAFNLDDRMGLVQDAFALSQAGFAKLSSSLTLVNLWKGESECKCRYRVFSYIVVEPFLL